MRLEFTYDEIKKFEVDTDKEYIIEIPCTNSISIDRFYISRFKKGTWRISLNSSYCKYTDSFNCRISITDDNLNLFFSSVINDGETVIFYNYGVETSSMFRIILFDRN